MTASLKGSASIAGIGLTDFTGANGRTHLELMAQAAATSLRDAGLKPADVDGLYVNNFASPFLALQSAEYLGLDPRVLENTNIGGSSFVSYLRAAAMAIRTGQCEVALIAYGSTMRSSDNLGQRRGPGDVTPYESMYRPRNPMASYALAAQRHMYEFGTTREHLAHVAVAARNWAMKNPAATLRDPLTVADVLDLPLICDPFTKRDCCLVSDAGAAVVMVAPERAAGLRSKPVHLLGVAEAMTHNQIAQMRDLTTTAAAKSGPQAFAMAGLGPADVDVMQLYDAFSINPILFLEDLGFCAKGEGGPFVAGGHTGPGGDVPVNTNGGGLSCVHPGMYGLFLVIEAVQQLRREAGARQVDGAEIALCNGSGGRLSSQVTAILGAAHTL